jgi:aspartate racemase
MGKIGLLGGIGPASSIEYYRLVIKGFQQKFNTKHYPEIIINSIDMTRMLDYVFNNQLDELASFLALEIKRLENAGVDFVAMASNTPHIVFDEIQQMVQVKMVSIVKETIQKIILRGLKKVLLFGTKSTMSAGFYQKEAADKGIEIVIPPEKEQNYIHDKYMGELVFNKILPETKKGLMKIVGEIHQKDPLEGLILGGTELPLILYQDDFKYLEVFDTTRIHVEGILHRYTS